MQSIRFAFILRYDDYPCTYYQYLSFFSPSMYG